MLFKLEMFQKTGAYKVRGVLNKMSRLSPEQKVRGVVTVSSGNHGQALAWSASMSGAASTVVMPSTSVQVKVDLTRGYGAEVVIEEGDILGRMAAIQEERGMTVVHPFDDPAIIAGAGTLGMELVEDCPDVDLVLCGIGGGGLVSGVSAAVKQSLPNARVVGVEPEGAQTMTLSLRQGSPAFLDVDTIADGLAAPFTGEVTLDHVQRFVDDVVVVSDAEIVEAMFQIIERAKVVAEPAAASTLAALLTGRVADARRAGRWCACSAAATWTASESASCCADSDTTTRLGGDDHMANDTIYDVLIAGQGAAGYAAAMYAARYQMRPVVLGAVFGGETATGGLIENYPGYPEIDGLELMLKFREARREVRGADRERGRRQHHRAARDCFELTTDEGNVYLGASMILAVGRERRTLGLEHETEWTGRGVSYCSTCDAPLHRDNVVGVVGGGDSAVKGAALLSKYARQVYVIYRRDSFTRPEPVNLRQLEASENVTTLFNTNVVGLLGDDGLDGVVLDRPHGGSSELAMHGLFIEIGADPRVELARQLGVELNDQDEVRVDKHGATNVEGVFAAGDLTDAAGDLKQTITAAASGALAATAAYEYVSRHGNRCAMHAAGYSIAAAS